MLVKQVLAKIADSWIISQSEEPQKAKELSMSEDFQQWLQEMPFSDRVSWAVRGMVLTAGPLFVRCDNCSVGLPIS